MALTGLGTWIRVRCVEMVVFVTLLHESHCNARKKKTIFSHQKGQHLIIFFKTENGFLVFFYLGDEDPCLILASEPLK